MFRRSSFVENLDQLNFPTARIYDPFIWRPYASGDEEEEEEDNKDSK